MARALAREAGGDYGRHRGDARRAIPASSYHPGMARLFGDDVVRGFAAGVTSNILNVSGLFQNFAAAQNAMTEIGTNTLITDARGDTLKLIGVAAGSLTTSELRFG